MQPDEEPGINRVSCVRYVKGIILALQSHTDDKEKNETEEREIPMLRIQAVTLTQGQTAARTRNAVQ